jgi:heterodisulfide reductase subunit C
VLIGVSWFRRRQNIIGNRIGNLMADKRQSVEINFDFRDRLNKVLGGAHHNFCYQCGACVAQCPAARYHRGFNPRSIVLDALLGREDVLISPDSPIWLCTNCYSCYERCPQDVRPIEVIVALKNMAAERGLAPGQVSSFTENITREGISGRVTPAVQRIRESLGLPKLKPVPVDEMLKILED